MSNFNGATGILVAYGKGMLQSLKVGDEIVLDVVPVDFTVNSLIAAGWKKGTESIVDTSMEYHSFVLCTKSIEYE